MKKRYVYLVTVVVNGSLGAPRIFGAYDRAFTDFSGCIERLKPEKKHTETRVDIGDRNIMVYQTKRETIEITLYKEEVK